MIKQTKMSSCTAELEAVTLQYSTVPELDCGVSVASTESQKISED